MTWKRCGHPRTPENTTNACPSQPAGQCRECFLVVRSRYNAKRYDNDPLYRSRYNAKRYDNDPLYRMKQKLNVNLNTRRRAIRDYEQEVATCR